MSKQKRLAEIADIRQGRYLAPTQMFDSASEEAPIPVWGANGVLGYTEKPTYTYRVPLVTCRGNGCGLVQWPDDKSYISNNAMGLEPKTKTKSDSSYLYYSLLACDFSDVITGSAQPQITVSHLSSKMVTWVDDENARGVVANVLSGFDRKIDINRRINQILEAIAQAIFQSWFVDFEPVKAKIAAIAEGRDPLRAAMGAISGKTEAEIDALPSEQYEQLAATAALFPDEMEASELGEIPRGWAFKSVADIAQFASGKVDVSSLDEDIYISTENMLENRGGVTRATSLPSVITVPSFKAGQILVSNIRPYFKKIWMARFDGGRSPDVLAFEPADSQWAEFLYNLMYQDAFFEFMTRTAKGAKMPRGDKDAIMGWKFPCPDELLMVVFSEKVRPIYAHTESLTLQSKSLAELRDTLLPKLLSGELSVADLEVPA